MHDIVASRVTDNCPLVASRGRGDGNLLRGGLISHLTRRIAMYVVTDEAISCATRYVASHAVSTAIVGLLNKKLIER